MLDEDLPAVLEPVTKALRSSISKQKAVSNNLPLLENLRAYGFTNALIAAILSRESQREITATLLASMMYRARKRKPPQKEEKHTPIISTETQGQAKPFRFGQGKVDPNAPIRRNTFEWDPVPDREKLYGKKE